MVEGYEWVFIVCAVGTGAGVLMFVYELWTMMKERRAHRSMPRVWTSSPRRVPIRVPGAVRSHRYGVSRSRHS